MRVTHVITRLIVGGAQENTVASVLGLRQKPGLDVDLVAGPAGPCEGSLEGAFDCIPQALTLLPSLVRPVRPWQDVRALAALTRRFRERPPAIVHTHSGKAGILGRLAARRAGVPLVVHTVHGPSFGAFQGAWANTAYACAERRAARWTTHFVVVARAMADQYLAAGVGRPEQFTCIRSGFDLAPFLAVKNDSAVRARLGLAPEDFVVGKLARLCERKGHDELIDAAPEFVRRCPRARFLLVGGGPWRGRLEARVRALGLTERFVFTGLVPPPDVPALVGVMDALVHLSRREGLARALPQALAAGKPVVALALDGAPEVCREGETGFLLQPGDQPALIARLAQLASDATLRQRLGQAGRESVRREFTVERMVDDLHALYLRLARERGIL
jgi:glycosyltransferase involved in cell wall biosynthesis